MSDLNTKNKLSSDISLAIYWALGQTQNPDYQSVIKKSTDKILDLIDQQVKQARIDDLKAMWNATQPDIVPAGWQPATLEGKYLLKRIKELEKL